MAPGLENTRKSNKLCNDEIYSPFYLFLFYAYHAENIKAERKNTQALSGLFGTSTGLLIHSRGSVTAAATVYNR
jgi:hypothetical protein